MVSKQIALLALTTIALTSCNDQALNRGRQSKTENALAPVTATTALPTPTENLYSQIGRERQQDLMTYSKEVAAVIKGNLAALFAHEVPLVAIHDEGLNGNSEIVKQARIDKSCGIKSSISSVGEAFADCNNLANSIWSGKKNAVNAEADWHLVVRNDDGKEVWMDQRTGLLWSDSIATQNWCNASSNRQNLGGVDCASLGTEATCLSNLHLDSKGNLDDKLVSWRLPTRNDYLQADIDGARFVLPNMGQLFWTATIDSSNRAQAWLYAGDTGVLSSADRSSSHSVRCVGRIIK